MHLHSASLAEVFGPNMFACPTWKAADRGSMPHGEKYQVRSCSYVEEKIS